MPSRTAVLLTVFFASAATAQDSYCPPSVRAPHAPLGHTSFHGYLNTAFRPTEAYRWPHTNPLLPHRVHPWKQTSYVQPWGVWDQPYVTKLSPPPVKRSRLGLRLPRLTRPHVR